MTKWTLVGRLYTSTPLRVQGASPTLAVVRPHQCVAVILVPRTFGLLMLVDLPVGLVSCICNQNLDGV